MCHGGQGEKTTDVVEGGGWVRLDCADCKKRGARGERKSRTHIKHALAMRIFSPEDRA